MRIQLLIYIFLSVMILACQEKPIGWKESECVLDDESCDKATLNCVNETDCIIRVNNLQSIRSCVTWDKECAKWENERESGPPSHTEQPYPNMTIAYCKNAECIVGFDCSRCEILKPLYDGCQNYTGGTRAGVCDMYNACHCETDNG
jgi:hypothetical protein